MSGPSSTTLFARFASALSEWSGRPPTFALAVAIILLWAISGPVFGFSATWQLVINTLTGIATFLMVFILQSSQNRDGKALQAKIDELILSSEARNRFVGIERLDEERLHDICATLPDPAKGDCEDEIPALNVSLARSG
jgi:low affinity Fe/Cu permease